MRRSTALAADLAVVLAFVLLGRREHSSGGGAAGALDTAWPFAAGALAGHAAVAALRWRPEELRSGALVVGVTALGGSALRVAVQGDGAPPSFVVVTTAVLAVGAVGWRLVVRRRPHRSGHGGQRRLTGRSG